MGNVVYWTSSLQKKNIYGDNMCIILKEIRNQNPYELLEKYEIELSPPIDISKLMDNIGISTIAKDFADIEDIMGAKKDSVLGAAFSNKNSLAIFYRRFDSLHRKKFTIAHELAHCCLHCPTDESSHIEFRIDPFVTKLSEEELTKEKEANIFAGQLLIPKNILIKQYEKMIVPSLTNLSEIFEVSTSVMAARLDYLKLPYFKDSQVEVIL